MQRRARPIVVFDCFADLGSWFGTGARSRR